MKIAILCPGPSLASFGGWRGYNATIGINRAAEVWPCTEWIALDHKTFAETEPLGRPRLVAGKIELDRMRREWPAAAFYKTRNAAEIGLALPGRIVWRKYGLTVAAVLAAELGASEVDIYGADWSGTKDFDGVENERHNRTPERWLNERRICERLFPLLASRGTRVRRITGDGESALKRLGALQKH